MVIRRSEVWAISRVRHHFPPQLVYRLAYTEQISFVDSAACFSLALQKQHNMSQVSVVQFHLKKIIKNSSFFFKYGDINHNSIAIFCK